MKLHRVTALVLRHLYLYQRSLPRMTEVLFWPLIDLLLWGFVTLYLQRFQANLPKFVTFFLGALILWDILYRAQQGISVSFLEEVWSKNLLNLFVTPMRPSEFLAALLTISIAKLLTAGLASAFLAWLFYSFNLFVLGLSLIPFVLNLALMGWAIGIITMASILLYGQEAEVMAWGLAFLVQPVSAVFYPVSVMPAWVQPIAWMMPSSHVFEGMRAVVETGAFPVEELVKAFILNLFYLSLALSFFYRNLRVVKEKGLLLRSGTE
ncbi:MAG: ABC transporter permease [Candidatus Manganitrophaceae bacterium]|nr:MAG: ABC transporter permease [Candidatus Manganitrophaceae bacterium]